MKFQAAKIELVVASLVAASWGCVLLGFLFVLTPILHTAAHASGREHQHGPTVPHAPHGANAFEHNSLEFIEPAVVVLLVAFVVRLVLIEKRVPAMVYLRPPFRVVMSQGP